MPLSSRTLLNVKSSECKWYTFLITHSDPVIKNLFCKRCNTRLDDKETFKQYHSFKPKRHYCHVECPFCLYRNKVHLSKTGV